MRTIETRAVVTADGQLSLRVPPNIPPGEHQVVLVIEEQPAASLPSPVSDFPVIHVASWPENLLLRREDLYDEWGR